MTRGPIDLGFYRARRQRPEMHHRESACYIFSILEASRETLCRLYEHRHAGKRPRRSPRVIAGHQATSPAACGPVREGDKVIESDPEEADQLLQVSPSRLRTIYLPQHDTNTPRACIRAVPRAIDGQSTTRRTSRKSRTTRTPANSPSSSAASPDQSDHLLCTTQDATTDHPLRSHRMMKRGSSQTCPPSNTISIELPLQRQKEEGDISRAATASSVPERIIANGTW